MADRCRKAGTVIDQLVPVAQNGNKTSIEIAASPDEVWQALDELTFRELRLTSVLMAVRSIPGIIARRGEFARRRRERPVGGTSRTLVEAMASSRFQVLHLDPPNSLVLGIVGQFWKPSGGDDVAFRDAAEFRAFDEPGYVKSAVDFTVEPISTGSRLSTETRNTTTDEVAARKFGRYWALVGWGSKLTRMDMLRAVKRRAER